jgi:GNAT superfamily N-acetyltransferase
VTNNLVRTDYRGATDLPELLHFGQRVWTPDNRWHVGDLAWDIGLDPEPSDDTRIAIWRRADEPVAVGWLSRPDQLSVVIGPDDGPLIRDVVEWAEQEAGTAVTVTVLDTETWLVRELDAMEFVPDSSGHFFLAMHRDLADLPPVPQPPAGFSLRPVRTDEVSARAELHRRVWSSSMTDATCADMMARRPYRTDFDWVAEAPDGSLVAYILGWYDDVHRSGEFEPVGTLEEFRRLGLSRALGIAVMHAFRDAGGERALVYARGDDDYPVPRQVYGSLGFTPRGRTVKYQPRKARFSSES